MSGQALIEPMQFARDGRRLDGEIAVEAMPRLLDVVVDSSGSIRYRVHGSIDSKRRAVIDVVVQGRLVLPCQRCLEPMDFDLQRRSRFVLVDRAGELPDVADEDPDTEAIPVDAMTDIDDVVEQEVLLGVPLAPMHEEAVCATKQEDGREDRPSPFAALEQLKRKS